MKILIIFMFCDKIIMVYFLFIRKGGQKNNHPLISTNNKNKGEFLS